MATFQSAILFSQKSKLASLDRPCKFNLSKMTIETSLSSLLFLDNYCVITLSKGEFRRLTVFNLLKSNPFILKYHKMHKVCHSSTENPEIQKNMGAFMGVSGFNPLKCSSSKLLTCIKNIPTLNGKCIKNMSTINGNRIKNMLTINGKCI